MTKVTEEMVNSAGQVFLDYDHFVPPALLERALEAALSRQGKVVSQEKL